MMVDLIPAAPWQKKLIEEDDKKRQGLALIIKGLPQAATSEDVSAMVEEKTTRSPLHVDRVAPGKVRIKCQDEEHREAVKKAYKMQRLQGGTTLTVSRDVVELTPKEIDKFMTRWLRLDQRISPHFSSDAEHHPYRHQREVQVKKEWGDASVSQVQEGRKKKKEASTSQRATSPAPPQATSPIHHIIPNDVSRSSPPQTQQSSPPDHGRQRWNNDNQRSSSGYQGGRYGGGRGYESGGDGENRRWNNNRYQGYRWEDEEQDDGCQEGSPGKGKGGKDKVTRAKGEVRARKKARSFVRRQHHHRQVLEGADRAQRGWVRTGR